MSAADGPTTRSSTIRSQQSLTVSAPVEVVWSLMIDVQGWPTWQPEVSAASIDGPLAVGTSFAWSSGGLDIVSTVEIVEPLRRVRWSGPAGGIWGVHTWTFEPRHGQVLVGTDETWAGAPVEADPERARRLLDGSLQRWLGVLATEASSRAVAGTTAERDA